MMLKRQYHPAELDAHLTAKALGAAHPPQPRVTHHTVMETGAGAEQNFKAAWVEQGVSEGWLTLAGDKLELKTEGEPMRYTVKRAPGYYCRSTGARIPVPELAWLRFALAGDSTQSRGSALAWLAANGKAPNDYEITAAYECVLDTKQHETFRGVRHFANVMAAHKAAHKAAAKTKKGA